MEQPPDGIELERHRDLAGIRDSWGRRVLLCCIAVLPLLALLNVFGQHPSHQLCSGPVASLSVTAPTRLRSGLIFQVKVKVWPTATSSSSQLDFDEGWWESMSVNSIVPEPKNRASKGGRVQLTYGKLGAGESLVSRIYFQVNPTNVGKRRENVTLADGETPLLTIHRSLTIFP